MTTSDTPGTCPIVGITGISPIRPISIRKWERGWVVIDHGGKQQMTVRHVGGWVTVHRDWVPACCWDMARGIAEILDARYRGDDLPGWADRPGHPPVRGGGRCSRESGSR